jgi:hypothetical protein
LVSINSHRLNHPLSIILSSLAVAEELGMEQVALADFAQPPHFQLVQALP